MWSELSAFFRDYMGNGLIFTWFLLSVIYLFVKEKKKNPRILFLYLPVVILLFFFNPFLAGRIYQYMGLDGYYRTLWLIPCTVVISYAVVQIYGQLQGARKKIFAFAAAALVVISGSFIYSSPLFSVAENAYHIPEEVVEICDAIEVEGREVRAVFPAELIQYVRQYSAFVFMPYGREILVDAWGNQDPLYDLMESEEIDADALCSMARDRECHYIVLSADKKIRGSLETHSYEVFAKVQDYVVYKDATVTLTY